MKLKLAFILGRIIIFALGADDFEKEFDNDLHLVEEETGGTLQLRSQGKLSNIVDLDNTDCIKVRYILCLRADKL